MAANRICPPVSTRLSIRKGQSIRSNRSHRLVPDAIWTCRQHRMRCPIRRRWGKLARFAIALARRLPSIRCMPSIDVRLSRLLLLLAVSNVAGQQPAGYAGSESCGICHEDISTAFAKSPHHAVDADKKRGWEGRACEACHGPGQKHTESPSADDILNPAKLTAAAADKLCAWPVTSTSPPTSAAYRAATPRIRSPAPAATKYTPVPRLVARKAPDINQLCASCHANVWAQFQKPFHHRLPEQAMSCVDCHNPHGSIRPAMTQIFAANEPGCFNCHGDKRGPFTFEHAPVRFEGCGACHEPHGSANPRMLRRQEVRFVCLECHATMPRSS